MAAFRVGQRVKKVRGPYNVGVTGTVTDVHALQWGELMIAPDFTCFDDAGFPFFVGTPYLADAHQWEPIQDRPELGSWDAIRELGLDVHAVAEAVA